MDTKGELFGIELETYLKATKKETGKILVSLFPSLPQIQFLIYPNLFYKIIRV